MKTTYLIFFVFYMHFVACSQTVRTICTLPNTLDENSGMLVVNENEIWVHNDGGDSAKLYLIDTFGTILKSILINNVTNIDWEDITYDNQGNVYVGEFGNNNNTRQNLKVYKIPHPDSIIGTTVTAETIQYAYPEQTAFPPVDAEKKYDTEAMVFYQDSLYLFTKDRTNPHQGYTWLYQISADTGTHAAVLLDSFHTNQISYIFEITGAALSPNQNQLALLNANRIWLFSDFVGNRFFDGTVQDISLLSTSQKEALDFVDSTHIYFSNESSFLGAASLGVLDLNGLITGNSITIKQPIVGEVLAYPNPTDTHLYLAFELREATTVNLKLVNTNGKVIKKNPSKLLSEGEQVIPVALENIPAGVYFVQLKCNQKRYTKRVVITK